MEIIELTDSWFKAIDRRTSVRHKEWLKEQGWTVENLRKPENSENWHKSDVMWRKFYSEEQRR